MPVAQETETPTEEGASAISELTGDSPPATLQLEQGAQQTRHRQSPNPRPLQGSSDPLTHWGVQSNVFRIKSLSASRHEACQHARASRRARQCMLQPNAASVPTKRRRQNLL